MRRMEESGVIPAEPVTEFQPTERMLDLFRDLENRLENAHDYGAADRMDELAFSILMEFRLLRREMEEQPDELRFRAAASWLKVHWNSGLSLDEVAAKFGFSRHHFYRSWRSYWGTTPLEFIVTARMELAVYLLRGTNFSIADIAVKTGFATDNYFSSCFHRRYGVTPLQFRKSRS